MQYTVCWLGNQREKWKERNKENDPCGSKVIMYDQCPFG